MLKINDVRGRNSHFVIVSINIRDLRVSLDISVVKCVLLSAVRMMCPSIHFVLPLIDRSIGGPSIDLCPSIGVSESSLMDRLGNAHLYLLSY